MFSLAERTVCEQLNIDIVTLLFANLHLFRPAVRHPYLFSAQIEFPNVHRCKYGRRIPFLWSVVTKNRIKKKLLGILMRNAGPFANCQMRSLVIHNTAPILWLSHIFAYQNKTQHVFVCCEHVCNVCVPCQWHRTVNESPKIALKSKRARIHAIGLHFFVSCEIGSVHLTRTYRFSVSNAPAINSIKGPNSFETLLSSGWPVENAIFARISRAINF